MQDDPGCGLAHSALAGTYLIQGRKELIRGQVDKALKANADDPAVHLWLALYHGLDGDYDQGIQVLKQIIARWPLFWPARLNLGEFLRERGDTTGAIRELERILEHDPHSRVALSSLARVYMDLGDLSRARQALERMRAQDRQSYRVRLYWALLLALEGGKTEALREMDGEVQAYAAGNAFLMPLLVAEFYALMGEPAKALEWLDRAVRMGDDREDWLRRDPHLSKIRDHPRFQQMLASVAYRRKQRSEATPESR